MPFWIRISISLMVVLGVAAASAAVLLVVLANAGATATLRQRSALPATRPAAETRTHRAHREPPAPGSAAFSPRSGGIVDRAASSRELLPGPPGCVCSGSCRSAGWRRADADLHRLRHVGRRRLGDDQPSRTWAIAASRSALPLEVTISARVTAPRRSSHSLTTALYRPLRVFSCFCSAPWTPLMTWPAYQASMLLPPPAGAADRGAAALAASRRDRSRRRRPRLRTAAAVPAAAWPAPASPSAA